MTAAILAAALFGAAPAQGPPCAACVRWEMTADQARALAGSPADLAGLSLLLPAAAADAVPALHARGAAVALATGRSLEGLPLADLEAVVITTDAGAPAAARAYAVKTTATLLRAAQPGLRIGLEGDAADGAYVDFVIGASAPAGVERWLRTPATSAPAALEATRAAAGPVLAAWPGPGSALDAPFALAVLRDLLVPGLAPLAGVEVGCDAGCAGEVFLHPSGDAVVLVRPRAPVRAVLLRTPGRAGPAQAAELQGARVYGLASPAPAEPAPAAETDGGTRVEAAPRADAFVVQVEGWGRAHGLFGSGVEVVAGRDLTVEEILARHQASAARQRAAVPRSIAQGALVIAFQAPGLSAPVTVAADVTVYSGPGGVEVEERALRLNGLAVGGGGVPRLPIVEPERVAALPLAITLGDAYRYRLEGREACAGRECYRVAFTPARPGPSLRGRAWIDTAQFALVRLSSTQTGLRGPIVSSQQTDEFAPVAHKGGTVWLLARSDVHQVYEGPGYRTPVDRRLAIAFQEPDPPDFERRLLAAHAGDAVMLRESAQGYEYLRKPKPSERGADGAGTRVPAGKATSVRTVALGLIVDPDIGDPLPFAGAGYSDFDLLGSGTQLNAFLAGAFAQVSWSAPSLLGSRWRLQAAAVSSLVEYNDRVFRGGREQYPENLRQRPGRFTLDVSRPLLARWRLRAGYELEYTRLRRSDLTAPAFRTPADALAQGLRVALEGERGPWTASAWWHPAWRARWHGWGFDAGEDAAAAARSYQRYGATLARALIASPRASGRIEVAAMAGRDLDRFSRYSFDAFDNRLVGYPASSVRYDRGLVARSAWVWQARPGLRLQGWADGARVRDAGEAFAARTLAGIGAGAEVALPWRTLLAAEWGFGFQGRDRDGHTGTHTLRVTAYRVF